MLLIETIRNAPKAYTIAGIFMSALLGGWFIFHVLGGPSELPDPAILKCTNCGELMFTTMGRANRMATIFDSFNRLSPGVKCPKCGQLQMAFALKCPKDGTIFFVNSANEKHLKTVKSGRGVCPQCGWDPQAQAEQDLKQVLGANR